MEKIPSHSSCQSKQEEEHEELRDFLCFKESRTFHTYVITHASSQESLLATLKSFFGCTEVNSPTEVLLLVANMNEVLKSTINHTRILIEETELSYQKFYTNKLVFLLLHFPPNMFYNHCYPTLFLDGWQHIFLDEIGKIKDVHYFNIEKWLNISLLETSYQHTLSEIFVNDSVWSTLLSESIVLSSGNVPMKQLNDFPPDDTDNDQILLHWLMIVKIEELQLVIKQRFYTYWQQEAMHELTYQIACYALTYHSSCTLSQTVQETIKSSFKEMVLYFICIINHHFVIHTLKRYDSNPELRRQLICLVVCKVLSVLTIPDSPQQLQVEVALLTQQSRRDAVKDISSPKFPFFNLIFDAMENIVNQAFKECSRSIDINSGEGYLVNDSDEEDIIRRTEVLLATTKVKFIYRLFAVINKLCRMTLLQ